MESVRTAGGVSFLVLFVILVSSTGSAATLNVQALIDGRSQLHIQGGDVYWQHYDYDAPGWRTDHYDPTTLNGDDWYPWPDSAGGNTNCNGCVSPTHAVLTPPLAASSTPVQLSIVTARQSVTIVQQPSEANGYEAVIEFNDNAYGGSDWYEVDITYDARVAVPTLSQWGMILLASMLAGAGLWFARKRRIAVLG